MSAPAPGKRTIMLDSSLQGYSKRSGRNKLKSAKINPGDGMTPKLKPNQFIRPRTLKRQLLARIKNHQKRHAQTSSITASPTQQPAVKVRNSAVVAAAPNVVATAPPAASQLQNETFAQSLEYLQSLAANSRENRHNTHKNHNRTHKARTNPINASTAVATTFGADAGSNQSWQSQSQSQPQVFLDAFPSQSNNSVMMSPASPFPEVSAAPLLLPPSPSSIFQSMPQQVPIQEETSVMLNQEPGWGCLKSGSKPTFRTFHNKTLKNNAPVAMNMNPFSSPVETTYPTSDMGAVDATTNATNANNGVGRDSSDIDADADADGDGSEEGSSGAVAMSESMYGTRQQRLEEYRQEQIKAEKKTVEPTIKIKQTKQHIITKKYKLGKYNNKTGPVIGVLIKNVQTQRNVEKKRNELRRVPLDTVITRLHKKRLLKVGSTAPPDILREMYESAVLAGDIENEGNDIAMHNFLSGDDTTNPTH
jgi:hypothetical protein